MTASLSAWYEVFPKFLDRGWRCRVLAFYDSCRWVKHGLLGSADGSNSFGILRPLTPSSSGVSWLEAKGRRSAWQGSPVSHVRALCCHFSHDCGGAPVMTSRQLAVLTLQVVVDEPRSLSHFIFVEGTYRVIKDWRRCLSPDVSPRDVYQCELRFCSSWIVRCRCAMTVLFLVVVTTGVSHRITCGACHLIWGVQTRSTSPLKCRGLYALGEFLSQLLSAFCSKAEQSPSAFYFRSASVEQIMHEWKCIFWSHAVLDVSAGWAEPRSWSCASTTRTWPLHTFRSDTATRYLAMGEKSFRNVSGWTLFTCPY